jgi:threonine synthase
MDAYRLVASCEGVMCEPASAASIAGLRKQAREGRRLADSTVVAVLTGHGLKDPAAALSLFAEQRPMEATVESVLSVLEAPGT